MAASCSHTAGAAMPLRCRGAGAPSFVAAARRVRRGGAGAPQARQPQNSSCILPNAAYLTSSNVSNTATRPRRRPRMVTAAAVGTTAAAAAATGAALSGSAPAGLASAAAAAALPALLQSAGLFVLCCAGALFLLASIPCLFAMARAAYRAEAVLRIIEAELPDTIATVKLPGMELTDTLAAMGACSSSSSSGGSGSGDGPGGGGSAAAAVAALATQTPAKPPKPGAKLRAFLAQRAHSDPELLLKARAAMRGTTTNVCRARFGLGVLGFVNYIRFMLDARQLEALRASLAGVDGGMPLGEESAAADEQQLRVQA